jgi:hypothetical protein
VKWARQLTDAEAAEYTPERVLAGSDGWNPKTGDAKSVMKSAKGSAGKMIIPAGSAWLAALPDGHLAWSTGGQWTITRAVLPAPAARIFRAPGDTFYAAWAVGKRLAISTSGDLLTWSTPQISDVMAGRDALDLNAPSVFHDGKQFIVTWSCTIAKNFIQAFQEDVEDNPRIWYATTRDFQSFSDPQVLFDNNYAVREAQILNVDGRFALLHSDSTGPMKAVRVAFGETPLGPWGPSSDAITAKGTSAPAGIRSGDDWWLYQSGGMVRTRDFWSFTEVTLPASMRPISVIEVPKAIANLLPR